MACKQSEKCDNADICKYAKSDAYNILGGSCYRPKEPQTNEEWLKSRSNKELANAIFSAFVESATMIGCCVTLERFRTQMELTDALREWLKQPHQKE